VITGSDVNLLGACSGGITAVALAAFLAGQGRDLIHSLSLFVSVFYWQMLAGAEMDQRSLPAPAETACAPCRRRRRPDHSSGQRADHVRPSAKRHRAPCVRGGHLALLAHLDEVVPLVQRFLDGSDSHPAREEAPRRPTCRKTTPRGWQGGEIQVV